MKDDKTGEMVSVFHLMREKRPTRASHGSRRLFGYNLFLVIITSRFSNFIALILAQILVAIQGYILPLLLVQLHYSRESTRI